MILPISSNNVKKNDYEYINKKMFDQKLWSFQMNDFILKSFAKIVFHFKIFQNFRKYV